jgi:hypothetical protein
MTIIKHLIRNKTKISHKYKVVIYHRNTPLPNVRKGLDAYTSRLNQPIGRDPLPGTIL